MVRIIPHLWFDSDAKSAIELYRSVFDDTSITSQYTIHDTPSGDCDVFYFNILGHPFAAINAGPYFNVNPSVSFMVNYDPSMMHDPKAQLTKAWEQLSEGGQVLMPLQEYPFSKWYGWCQDRFGVSWQLILTDPSGEDRPRILPCLLFVGEQCGRAEEARQFYLDSFDDTKPGAMVKYDQNSPVDKPGTVMFSDFRLENYWFVAMDSAADHKFAFNEAISFIIDCDSQEEIDRFWSRFSKVPAAEQCGWCKDQFGVSWQVSPGRLDEMLRTGSREEADRVTQAMLKMKKLDVAALEQAFKGS